MIDVLDIDGAAPRPWNWESVAAHASGGCHLYLVDATGRKIAAVWGKAGEKLHTAQLIVDAVNAIVAAPPTSASIEDIGAALHAIGGKS